MKTNSLLLLSLACLSLTSLSATAADAADESETVQLPTFVVTEPRQTPAEKQIQQNLDALRALAAKPVTLQVALPSLEGKKTRVEPDQKMPAKSVVVAGL